MVRQAHHERNYVHGRKGKEQKLERVCYLILTNS
jgi:hypothetical protein